MTSPWLSQKQSKTKTATLQLVGVCKQKVFKLQANTHPPALFEAYFAACFFFLGVPERSFKLVAGCQY